MGQLIVYSQGGYFLAMRIQTEKLFKHDMNVFSSFTHVISLFRYLIIQNISIVTNCPRYHVIFSKIS